MTNKVESPESSGAGAPQDSSAQDKSAPAPGGAPPAAAAFTERQALWFFAGFLLITAALATSVSYIDEDAFISFRTVENFVHGHGLRWNLDERVQTFTNPLWVLLLIPVRALVGDVLRASFLVSILCSTAAAGVVAWRLRREPLLLGLGFFLPLFLSRAFTDYTSSGFENPLTFLLVGLFAVRFLEAETPIPWRPLTALAALAAVNRLDAVLLFAPAMAWLYLTNRRRASHRAILIGALPLIAWLLFSLFYFGMPYPNTKYAKLDAGFGPTVYFKFGGAYLLDVLRNDTVTFAGLLGGIVTAVAAARLWLRDRSEVWGRLASLGMGVLVTVVYVVYIGGDFMAGRHWASPFFLSIIVIAFALRERGLTAPAPMLGVVAAALACRFAVEPLVMQRDTLQTRDQGRFAIVRNMGIRDQRFNCSFYEALLGARGPATEHSWSKAGLRHKEQAARFLKDNPGKRYVVVSGGAGKEPFYAGPDAVFVDSLAITDPLLARLPDADGKFWFSGHLGRHVPDGYVHARRTGSLDQMDPELAKYYAELRHIISGPLFDWDRLVKIGRFHLGQYDHHKKQYLAEGYVSELARVREENAKAKEKEKEKEKEKKKAK